VDKNNQAVPLVTLDKTKDIGVYFDDKLWFKEHARKNEQGIYDYSPDNSPDEARQCNCLGLWGQRTKLSKNN